MINLVYIIHIKKNNNIQTIFIIILNTISYLACQLTLYSVTSKTSLLQKLSEFNNTLKQFPAF